MSVWKNQTIPKVILVFGVLEQIPDVADSISCLFLHKFTARRMRVNTVSQILK